MNDMPTITITIEEYMHLRACENKCNAEDYRENDIDVHFIKSNDKDYPTIPMALVPFRENYNLISLRVGDTKPLTVVPLFQVLDAISYPKADYIVIDGVKCCPTCRKPVYPKNDKPSGEWIANAPQYDMLNPQYICSECGNAHTRITPYCEMCGAKMFDPQERSDKDDKI